MPSSRDLGEPKRRRSASCGTEQVRACHEYQERHGVIFGLCSETGDDRRDVSQIDDETMLTGLSDSLPDTRFNVLG
jgi:hypothetical protein